ncbi:hypothetical protein OG883_42580 [Streptomyces sp. NBC_01142]|uniref:hypothetical protein n=1 Tax=Streptomyces sp. NBC_01142 TaxID=2975865 RepID=UPI00225C0070|nr:hypothetical protein [Streptomyces sp. NBC_01142]MCX4826330.1 hypothetical protein [Streptomyces sp. NBC_01142]
MRELILLHGRSQQFKDAADLKEEWVQALRKGLANADVTLDVPDKQIRFPYYGDTLHRLAKDMPGATPDVIIKGYGEPSAGEQEFLAAVVAEAVKTHGISEADIRAAADPSVTIEKGVQNWPWVKAALRAIDKVPGLAGATLALVTSDVYSYMRKSGIQMAIEEGVRPAFTSGEECVVVAHSLGTVIAYNMLKRDAKQQNWKVPTLVTLGSPLAVGAIVSHLRPIDRPYGIDDWFNAFDPQDVVALHPLDHDHFPVDPGVENFSGMRNDTPNRHGITGYLEHPKVARRIRDALLDSTV